MGAHLDGYAQPDTMGRTTRTTLAGENGDSAMKPYGNGRGPQDATIAELVRGGYNAAMLADRLGVNISTARYYMRRAGVVTVRDHMSHERFLPWTDMTEKDSQDEISRTLRFWSQQAQGITLRPDYESKVTKLRGHLELHDRVVAYSRQRGYRLVPRDPAIDDPDLPVRRPPA